MDVLDGADSWHGDGGRHPKHDRRAAARALRLAGRTYDEIVAEVGVSKSTVSLWVRDLPKPPPRDRAAHARMMNDRRWEPYRRRRDAERRETIAAAMAEVGALSGRELLLIGAALYWAEGTKAKPWARRDERVVFTNSDPDVIQVFLRWLDRLGVAPERRTYRVAIHESADLAAAHRYWADLIGISVQDFQKPSIKRHNPRTVRHNVGAGYHGCLVIKVYKSAELYRRIEGWWQGIAMALPARAC